MIESDSYREVNGFLIKNCGSLTKSSKRCSFFCTTIHLAFKLLKFSLNERLFNPVFYIRELLSIEDLLMATLLLLPEKRVVLGQMFSQLSPKLHCYADE